MDRRWILGGVLLASGFGFVRALTHRPKLDDHSRVLLIGDSLAQGMMPHFRGLAEDAGIAYVGTGIPGTRIDQWVASDWLTRKLTEFKPTHVFISLGTNDAFSNIPEEVIKKNALALLEKLKGVHVIWIGAPALPEKTSSGAALRLRVLEDVRALSPYYFDSTNYIIPRGPDGLHPSAAGYAGWAGAVWNWLS